MLENDIEFSGIKSPKTKTPKKPNSPVLKALHSVNFPEQKYIDV